MSYSKRPYYGDPSVPVNGWNALRLEFARKRVRTVSAVAVAVALIALPYLVFRTPSVDQIWREIASRMDRNSGDTPLQQSTVPPELPQIPETNSNGASEEVASSESSEVSMNAAAPDAGAPDAGAMPDASSSSDAALDAMLARAATRDKTVIVATLNEAWATPGTMIDVFLESFHKGENTAGLLNHLVLVALDQRSFERCRALLHRHCFRLQTAGVDFSGSKGFMTMDFLKMMWRRMSLLRSILEMGYNFVFTDADVLWFRNPFDHFASDADFQISCDLYTGSSTSVDNRPNCGYQYARSNNRTIAMYRHWCKGGDEDPHTDEQTLLNRLLRSHAFAPYNVTIRFLPTEQFSGFCEKSKNMSRVVTMHANCCIGLGNKVQDLRKAFTAWEAGKSLDPAANAAGAELWHVPAACLNSLWPKPPSPGVSRKRDNSSRIL